MIDEKTLKHNFSSKTFLLYYLFVFSLFIFGNDCFNNGLILIKLIRIIIIIRTEI